MGGLVIKGPNGSDAVTLQQSTNVTKVVEASDIASDAFVKRRVGTDGGFSFRNKIVDGRFDFWYEGTSVSNTNLNTYGAATMLRNAATGSTNVMSQQTLTAGVDLPSVEVPTAKYFVRNTVTSVVGAGNFSIVQCRMENVRTLAGKVATLSFYAKADSAKNIAVEFTQNFGTGGSANVNAIGSQLIGLSTVWKRYSAQITIPSISGMTIGASGDDYLYFNIYFEAGTNMATRTANLTQQSGTFDLACIQLEEGSVATPFEELPIEVSQQRVNRYYEVTDQAFIGYAGAAGPYYGWRIPMKVAKRAVATCSSSGVSVNNGIVSVVNGTIYNTLINFTATAVGGFSYILTITNDARL